MRARHWLSRLAGRLLPVRCLLCAAAADASGSALCAGCREDLADNRPCCPSCAEPLQQPEPLCGRCLRRQPPFDDAYAPFLYAWPLDGLVTRFKFGGDLAAGRCLAQLFTERAKHDALAIPAVLVPVPLHVQRLRRRGYDQALELARDIGRALAMPVATRVLRRLRATDAQTELSLRDRRRNVRGAFAVDAGALAKIPTDRGAIALLDDVMTSGSTLAECARVLRRAGCREIRVWAIARAPIGKT